MSAALLVMVCNLTIGRKRYADVQTEVESIAARALALRDRARALADEDEQAYDRVSRAMKLPRDTADEQEARRRELQSSLKSAAVPPLATMRVAVEVLAVALELAPIGNRSAVSDVGSAGYLAAAGCGAARLNVQINLSGVTDPDWSAETRSALDDLGDVEELASQVQDAVARVMSS